MIHKLTTREKKKKKGKTRKIELYQNVHMFASNAFIIKYCQSHSNVLIHWCTKSHTDVISSCFIISLIVESLLRFSLLLNLLLIFWVIEHEKSICFSSWTDTLLHIQTRSLTGVRLQRPFSDIKLCDNNRRREK